MSKDFVKVNELSAAGVSEFQIASFDGYKLVIIGSFDLAYYHDIEVVFKDVSHINCPTDFRDPKFAVGAKAEEGRRFRIETDEGDFEIHAAGVEVSIRKVYHTAHAETPPGVSEPPLVGSKDARKHRNSSS